MSRRPRTALHGTCLLDGKHPAGSVWAGECPLANAGARSARSRRAARTRWGTGKPAPAGGSEHPAPSPSIPPMLGGGPERVGGASSVASTSVRRWSHPLRMARPPGGR